MTRLIAVGDVNQSIYQFRGADNSAMGRLRSELQAIELPLSTCYRCAKEIVATAKELVEQIEPHELQIDGLVSDIDTDEMKKVIQDGDYVLCRTTAPLVSMCLKYLMDGKRAMVKGRDIGKNLLELIEVCDLHNGEIEAFLFELDKYVSKMNAFYSKIGLESKQIELDDKAEALRALSFGQENVEGVVKRINTMFQDDVAGIVFCTVHRSKGLETKRVFIIRPELLPHPRCKQEWQLIQEKNLHYVAITRAKEELYYVQEPIKK